MSVSVKSTPTSYKRFTISLPKKLAAHVDKIPAQQRSKEIAEILESEFERRVFVKKLHAFAKAPSFMSKNLSWPKIKERKMEKDIYRTK